MLKTIQVMKTMQILDLNGSKTDFVSDVSLAAAQPILVAVVSQDQLDQGALNFVATSADGRFQQRVTSRSDGKKYQNYFLALKKDPADPTDTPVSCDVAINLRPLSDEEQVSPIARPDLLAPSTNPALKDELTKELYETFVSKPDFVTDPNVADVAQTENKDMFYTIGVIAVVLFFLVLARKYKII